MSELAELKKTLNEVGEAFHEFKKQNDSRLKDIESGKTGSDASGNVEAINEKLTELGKEKKALEARIDEMEKKANRIPAGGDSAANAEDVAAHKAAFAEYFRKGKVGNLRELERKALEVGSDPSGGYTVNAEIDSQISRVVTNFSAMRALATVRPISSGEYKKFVNVGGANSGWVGEKEPRSETNTPSLEELAFNACEVYAEPRTTQQLIDDSIIDIAGWLSDEVAVEFAEQEGDKFLTGDGVKQPRGLLTYPTVANANYAWGSVGFITSGVNGGFAAAPNSGDKLIDLVHSLKRGYRSNGSFLLNDLTLAEVRKLKDSDGNYLWRAGLEEGHPDRLLGYGVESDDFMPDMATDSLSIAFGDFARAYLIVDRIGVRVLRDDITEKQFVKFYTTKRVGGGIQNFEALKFMKFAA